MEDKIYKLFLACQDGDVAYVKQYLEENKDTASPIYDGTTPLHVAAGNGKTDVVSLLIDHGYDVNAKDEDDWTPLHASVIDGYEEIAIMLIDKGAQVNVVTANFQTPFCMAVDRKHLGSMILLYERGALTNTFGYQGIIPFFLACDNFQPGDEGIIDFFYDKKLNFDKRNTQLSTFQYACERGLTSLAKYVFQKNYITPIIPEVSRLGDKPLHISCRNNLPSVSELIIRSHVDRKISIDPRNKFQATPLMLACDSGCLKTVELLLKNVANVRAQDSNKRTPLHYACQKDDIRIVERLISWYTPLNVVDGEGRTPLDIAFDRKKLKMSKILTDAGARTSTYLKKHSI